MATSKKVVIVGAGYGGLSAAYDLARAGFEVTVLEREKDIGGLAGTFELTPGTRLEKFYHHWFSGDVDIIGLIRELGLGEQLRFLSSNTGLYYANSIFRLASPLDLLRFRPLPLLDRIRTGLMVLRARRINDYKELENISATEWLCRWGGERAYKVIWEPLLAGKFGPEAPNVSAVWFWNKLKLRGSSRDSKGSEQLVYFEKGFGALTEQLRAAVEAHGVTIKTGTTVCEIVHQQGKVSGARTATETLPADIVLFTSAIPEFLEITPGLSAQYIEKCKQVRYLGNVCLVLRLKRSLSDTYWLNVADPSFPFVGIIEHTNFDDPANYGGEHIAYLSKYLPTSEPMFSMSDEEVLEFCVPFIQRIFPEFTTDWLVGHTTWRAEYSQPVITKRYSEIIPPFETPISGLYLSTMAQIYPEDRGTNYAVRQGRKAAQAILHTTSQH